MTFRMYLAFMGISSAIAWGAWYFVMQNVNPFETNAIGFILFYVTFSFGLIGFLSLVGSLYRVQILGRKDVISREVKVAFRHALLLSAVSVLSFFLTFQGVFNWWILFVIIIVACVIEYVSLIVQHSHRG